MWENIITQLLNSKNRGRLMGVAFGLLFGIFAAIFGIWKTIFMTFCIIIGYYIGKRVDEQGDFKSLLDKVINRDGY